MRTRRLLAYIPIALALTGSVLASEEGHAAGWGWAETMGRWLNLLILFGGLTYFLRQPARQFFSNRKAELQKKMRQAEEAREAAEARLAEAEERMAKLDAELDSIRSQAAREAELEKERIRKQSEEEIQRILAVARREMTNLGQAVRQDLKNYAAEIAVQMAGDRLREQMGPDSDSALTERFLSELKTQDRRN